MCNILQDRFFWMGWGVFSITFEMFYLQSSFEPEPQAALMEQSWKLREGPTRSNSVAKRSMFFALGLCFYDHVESF